MDVLNFYVYGYIKNFLKLYFNNNSNLFKVYEIKCLFCEVGIEKGSIRKNY